MSEQKLLLHTYFRSSCSARVRTAAHLKGIPLQYIYINLISSHQSHPDYTSTNPSASVPTLTITSPSSKEPIVIRQSVAILEFLEETYPDQTPLLPPLSDPIARARVRELVNIISSDIQPPTNLRILKKVKKITQGDDKAGPQWAKDLMEQGLKAYDSIAEGYAGRYSVGDAVTLADVCLAPAVEGALRWGVDVQSMPTVWRVYENAKELEAFKKGDWRHQEDTPEDLREKL
jgi:maleylacetoacetate isomerase